MRDNLPLSFFNIDFFRKLATFAFSGSEKV